MPFFIENHHGKGPYRNWIRKILDGNTLNSALLIPFVQKAVRFFFDTILCSIILFHSLPILMLILVILSVNAIYKAHIMSSFLFFSYMILSYLLLHKNEMKYKVGGLILHVFKMGKVNMAVLNALVILILVCMHAFNLIGIGK